MAIRPRKISEVKSLLTNVAQTSHYEVRFGGLPSDLIRYLAQRSIGRRFTEEDAGLLCFNAVIPTARLATGNVTGNYMGITENFAHSKQYNTLTLEFYVDSRYRSLRFMESWIDFISSGSSNPVGIIDENPGISEARLNYFVRMHYPQEYKSNRTKIIKFDRDYRAEVEYNFVGLFPYAISEIPVSYESSQVMKMSVQFYYDRFIAGKVDSINEKVKGNFGGKSPYEPLKLTTPRRRSAANDDGTPAAPGSARGDLNIDDLTQRDITRIAYGSDQFIDLG